MKKKFRIILYIIIPLFSGSIAYISKQVLSAIDANLTLLISVPIVFFSASAIGFWLLFNIAELYFFKKKRIKGYQLRAKITSIFMLSTTGFLVLLGVLLFSLVFLIENTVIESERKTADSLLNSYQKVYQDSLSEFIKKQKKLIIQNPNSFTAVFTIKANKPKFIIGKINQNRIVSNLNRLKSISNNNNIRVFDQQTNNQGLLIQSADRYYYQDLEPRLKAMQLSYYENMETLSGLRKIKDLIFPVSFISFFILSIPILAGVFLVSLRIARSITNPVEEIATGTKILSRGNMDFRLKIRQEDEIGDLARHFNEMAHRLQIAQQQIQRMERIEAWQEVARRLAHEIKNPLTPIKLSAERMLLAYDNRPDEFQAILAKTSNIIIKETRRLENLVNEFSRFARLPVIKTEKKNILPFLMETADFYQNAYPDFSIQKDIPSGTIFVFFDQEQIRQVLNNLMSNAVEACLSTNKRVIISAVVRDKNLRISVRDSGNGVPKENKNKIFEPYFTTRENGSGLGLAIAERIILEHKGLIWFESLPDGTEFRLELPLAEEESETTKEAE